jgi:arylsulfatase A-like enzyme
MDRAADAPRGRESFWKPLSKYWNVPLMRDTEIIERPAEQTTITRRYTEQAVEFIKANRERPFFLYLAHSMPHVPLFRSKDFVDRSSRGLYGDVIEEIDWSVGQVLGTLRDSKLAQQTLVVFSSDNGPWLVFDEHGGSAGLLRDGKGSTWEGGMREPTIAWRPGSVPAGAVSTQVASTMDLFATAHHLAGLELPKDRTLDSYDLTAVLHGQGPSKRKLLCYYRGYDLMAVRQGPFKAHFKTQSGYGDRERKSHDPPLLFNLEIDPGESYDVAAKHPEVIAAIRTATAAHRQAMKPAESQLEK